MFEWQDKDVLELCGFILGQSTNLVLGMFIWRFILTFPCAELPLLTRRTKLRLVHVPYLLARYLQLLSLVCFSIQNQIKSSDGGCGGTNFLIVASIAGNTAIAAASANFGLRVIMLWQDNVRITFPICVVTFIHIVYAIAVGIAGPKKHHDPVHNTCTLDMSDARIELLALYLFTFWWDLVVLTLTVLGLRRRDVYKPPRLASVVCTQGVFYALISGISTLPVVISIFLRLNATMDIMFVPAGCTLSVAVSCAYASSLMARPHEPAYPEIKEAWDDEKEDPDSTLLTSYFEFPSTATRELTGSE